MFRFVVFPCFDLRYTSKRTKQFVKFVPHFLRRTCTALFYGLHLDLCGKRRTRYCGTFWQTRRDFWQTCCNPRIAVPYKTAHCGAAIKVRRTRWKKSGTHGSTFVSLSLTYTAGLTVHSWCARTIQTCETSSKFRYFIRDFPFTLIKATIIYGYKF